LFPKEEEAQKPYDFYFNNCFMITGFVANKEQKLDVTEGDIFKDIQEVWVEAISTEVPGTISTKVPGEISIEVPREISRIIAKAKVEKVEERNQ